MDLPKSELTKEQRAERKKAKRLDKSLEQNESRRKRIVEGILATRGITPSQASEYEKGGKKDERGEKFSSQDCLKMYEEGYESDSSSEA